MDIMVYNKVLNTSLEDPSMKVPDTFIDIRSVLESMESDLLWFSHFLVKTGQLRGEYSSLTRDLFNNTLFQSLRVLRGVCKSERREFSDTIAQMKKTSEDKNHDYSGVNILKGMHLGLVVRMGDKISRILNLLSKPKGANKVTESLIDTASDLVNYSIYLTLISVGAWSTKEEIRAWVKALKSRKQDSLASVYKYTPPRKALELKD